VQGAKHRKAYMEPRAQRAREGVMHQIFCCTRGQGNCTAAGAAPSCTLFYAGGREPVAHGLGARRGLCLLLKELQQPLSASPRQLPRGQASPWGAGAGPVEGGCVHVRGEWLGSRAHLCSDGVGLFLALHVMALQHSLDLAQVLV
jgi:hypothetical protein